MICKACNAANEDGALFCANCGATLEPAPAAAPVYEAAPECEVLTADPGKGLGITALILSIAGLVLATLCSCGCGLFMMGWLPSIIGFILSVVGMILGIVASKKSKAAGCKNGMATVGMILGIVGVVLGVVSVVASIVTIIIGGFGSLLGAVGGSSYSDPYSYGYYGY